MRERIVPRCHCVLQYVPYTSPCAQHLVLTGVYPSGAGATTSLQSSSERWRRRRPGAFSDASGSLALGFIGLGFISVSVLCAPFSVAFSVCPTSALLLSCLVSFILLSLAPALSLACTLAVAVGTPSVHCCKTPRPSCFGQLLCIEYITAPVVCM